MPSPDNALQAGLYVRLTAYDPLLAALGGQKVYDYVSPKLAAPYVVIGEDTLTGDNTKTELGWDCTVTIHVWDFERAGRKSVKTLLSLVYDALHRQEDQITLAGFSLVEIVNEFQTTIQETGIEGENDHYYHGIARYRALIDIT
jgi:hypothetical protein